MSSSPSEPENAATTRSVRPESAHRNSGDGGDLIKSVRRPWTQPPRAKSASLLTQALATNYEADEHSTSFLTHSPDTNPPLQGFSSQDGSRRTGMTGIEGGGLSASTTESVGSMASGYAADMQTLTSSAGGLFPTTVPFNLHDMRNVDSLLMSHREFLSGPRGRGTSLERTEKEKRVQELPKGTYSTNAGDTGMSRPATPLTPPATGSISANPHIEGVRAQYRSWRDARPAMAAEKAWSIGEHGSHDSQGGQVEKSIAEALAGVEPNNRSRKASHSLRFFKEGLPEDQSLKRDAKNRGRSKEGLSRGQSYSETDQTRTKSGPQSPRNDDILRASSPATDKQSPTQTVVECNPDNPREKVSPALSAANGLANGDGYFDTTHIIEAVSEEQLKTMPAQLLDEIRRHHNLTPGAAKGSSFSQSIPVTASEKLQPMAANSKVLGGDLVVAEAIQAFETPNDADPSHIKSADEEDDSGEEQISSALFVPHKTSHESAEREKNRKHSDSGLDHENNHEDSNSQWLEEHAVPSQDVDKYLSHEGSSRPLPSPIAIKPPTTNIETETASSGTNDPADTERDANDDGGYTTLREESGLTDDDPDITPKGSYQPTQQTHMTTSHRLHDHQHKPKQPLETIELIPYRHQVGGHTTMWRFSKRAVCKQLNNSENKFYETVEQYHPELLKFLPRYIGVLNVTFEKQNRRKSTKKDGSDVASERQNSSQDGLKENSEAEITDSNAINGHDPATNHEGQRIISQSLNATSEPTPTVTVADNRHILPSSFLKPRSFPAEFHHRSISDSVTTSPSSAISLARLDSQVPSSGTNFRPHLYERPAHSWGATTVNKDLRNEVFADAFLGQPIPIQSHKKPASRNRTLPHRKGSTLRSSSSDTSLKTAQQTQAGSSHPLEESIRKKAMKTAAERRNGLTPLTKIDPAGSDVPAVEEESDFDEKAGTSAPEPEISYSEGSRAGKRQRRYSSGGLRRKPTEVAEGRGNLKYFEEADEAGYKGDVEEGVFAMDAEPIEKTSQSDQGEMKQQDSSSTIKTDYTISKPTTGEAESGNMLPAAPEESLKYLNMPRPVNPKEARAQPGSRVEYFLLLEDLTAGMKRPCIMDLKMGTRQYGVEANEKKQLSQRRKCAATTSKELGVRVCGLQVWDVKSQTYIFQDKYFGRDLKVGREFQNALQRFLYDGIDYSSVLRHIPTILRKLSKLEVIIRGLDGYRFYAASLLMFYDGNTEAVDDSDSAANEKETRSSKDKEIDFKIADFANCVTKEALSNDRPCPPSHPDSPDNGFLRGLRSLRKYFLAIQQEIRAEMGISHGVQGENSNGLNGADEGDEGGISY